MIDDPAVVSIANELELDIDAVVGKLIRVWMWADNHVTNGDAFVTLEFVDRVTQTSRFGYAMVNSGWLEELENGGIRFPKWERHMSKSAKTRALGQRRSQKYRNARVTTRASRSRDQRREEKRDGSPLPPLGEMGISHGEIFGEEEDKNETLFQGFLAGVKARSIKPKSKDAWLKYLEQYFSADRQNADNPIGTVLYRFAQNKFHKPSKADLKKAEKVFREFRYR